MLRVGWKGKEMKNKEEKIMQQVDKIEHEDAGLLGFVVFESINDYDNSYEETGQDIIRLFETYPEQAEWFEKMLIAVCGWGIEFLRREMESQRDYYDSL